ncbi:hypothetical protein GCM10010336_26890 [Streptomyces goshikiensis]|nr:hypothetical protein GCM10010336_26890 [Streptomyces goshikiensis]
MDDQTRFVVGQGLDHLVVGQVALDVEFQGAGMVRVAQDHGVDLPCLLQVLEGIEALFGKGGRLVHAYLASLMARAP